MKKNWKEVTLDSLEVQCSLPDATHRAGLCIVDIGVLHGNCPNIPNYNGEQLGKMSPGFATWDSRIKSIFYDSYVIHGPRGSDGVQGLGRHWVVQEEAHSPLLLR